MSDPKRPKLARFQLTAAEGKAATEWLTEKVRSCPTCNTDDMILSNQVHVVRPFVHPLRVNYGQAALLVVCKNCGHMMLFDASRVADLRESLTKDDDEEAPDES